MELRVEYVVVYSIRKHPGHVHHDNPSPYLAGVTIDREEYIRKMNITGGAVTSAEDNQIALRLFAEWCAALENRLARNNDLLTKEPKLLKRITIEEELA